MTGVTCAMVLAAGLGSRMGGLTRERPKPLLELAGRALIDHALDRLEAAGIARVVVNLHYKAELIEAHLAARTAPPLTLIREATRLETGGGVANALAHLGPLPFFVLNADVLWRDGDKPTLARLADRWDDAHMDALLLVHGRKTGGETPGDFALKASGRLERKARGAPYRFTGVQLLHPRLFTGCPEGPFSLNLLYDRAQARGRLYGLAHDGLWLHAGTPEELARAKAALAS
ncbi:MAG TPA: nucleotidyltransferase family protein [Alphaproteobacteria bacterium]|nr:nucleotidyltransferase family protein [Alphaproteobacteria bacterium]